MAEFTAFIPQRILYVCREPQDVKFGWDEHHNPKVASPTIRVSPAFPVDADSKGDTRTTARHWAQRRFPAPTTEPVEAFAPNEPIPSVQLVTLEARDEGGRAYKVVLPARSECPENLYVDVREDVLLNTILAQGIEAGGRIQGPFIWARVGSQMKLIRVGSALHEQVLEAHARGVAKDIKADALEPGNVYRNRKGELFVYLGQCDTDDLIFDYPVREYGVDRRAAKEVRHTEIRNQQGWFELLGYKINVSSLGSLQGAFDDSIDPKDTKYGPTYWCFKTVKKKAAVEIAGSVKLPEDVWGAIRAMGLRALEAHVNERLRHERPALRFNEQQGTHWRDAQDGPVTANLRKYGHGGIEAAAAFAYLRLARAPGEPRPELPEYKGIFKK